jgi:ubiquinone/menaquinone biosynthesis C-methylase UbiE
VRLFRLRKRDRFTPDTFLEDGDRLDEHGLDATVLHVPGHSAGSIAVLTADGVLFSGDFLENRTRPSLATLVDDAEAMKASFERAKRLDVRIVYPGHGEPFTMDEIGNPDAGHRPASRTEAKRSTSKTRSVGEEDGSSLNARKAGTIVKTDTSVARQYESWANSYDRDKVEIIERDLGISLEAFVDRILDRCHLTAGQRVIDVGTGTGLIAISIAKRLSNDCNILGIDLSDAMLGKAKVRVKEEGVEQSVALRKASALDIPVEDATQDLVVCVFTIRHTDIRETLRGFMRVLKPGGRAVVVDLCAPRKWRSIPARVLLPLFRVGLLLAGRKVRAERRSTLLTASEWETLIEETHGRTAEVEEFPNRTEPDWKPGKVIVAWNRDEFGTGR